MRNTKLAVILSERGPRRQVFVAGVGNGVPNVLQFGGGESKNLRLFFDELQTHHTGCALDPLAARKSYAASWAMA